MKKDLFTATKEERVLIEKIVKRYLCLVEDIGGHGDEIDLMMDLEAVHCNGVPLRLEDLLAADDFNLVHDVSGISARIDRRTGKLTRCFLPRFARRGGEGR